MGGTSLPTFAPIPDPLPMRYLVAGGALVAVNLLLAVLWPLDAADAGSALRLDLPALVSRSDLIVEGRVLAAEPVEAEGLLQTEYLLEVSRTLKGEDRAYRALRLPGGLRDDGSGLLLPGVPRLVPGEETLLFLGAEGPAGMRLPTGLAQGRFGLQRDPSGRKQLSCDTRAIGLLDPSDGKAREGERRILDYAELVATIEAAVRTGSGR